MRRTNLRNRKKNMIAQKVIALVLLVLSIVALPALDYDATVHIIFIFPSCIYLLVTQEVVIEVFR